jgi:hypothetical protein
MYYLISMLIAHNGQTQEMIGKETEFPVNFRISM